MIKIKNDQQIAPVKFIIVGADRVVKMVILLIKLVLFNYQPLLIILILINLMKINKLNLLLLLQNYY